MSSGIRGGGSSAVLRTRSLIKNVDVTMAEALCFVCDTKMIIMPANGG